MSQLKKVMEQVAEEFGNENQDELKKKFAMKLGDFKSKVEAFNNLGKSLYEMGNMMEVAKELEAISEGAESFALRESTSDDEEGWFDGVTIKRNMKELKSYVSEFTKCAREAQQANQRMTALYEDCGRVLGRYFDIQDVNPDKVK